MKQLDERILEHLDCKGWATPSIMAKTKGFSASEGHIRERCLMLADIEFISPYASNMYELTTDGILYLHGEIDARHRPEPAINQRMSE